MKKLLALLMAAIMVFSFAACGVESNGDEDLGSDAATEGPEIPADNGDRDESVDDGEQAEDPEDDVTPEEPEDDVAPEEPEDDVMPEEPEDDVMPEEPEDDVIFEDPDKDPGMDIDEVLSFMPALPFSGLEGGFIGGNIYEYSVLGLNTSGATNPPDSGEPDGKDKDIFVNWLGTLPSYAFEVLEVGNGYMWTAADAYGNFVTFTIGDGGLFITIERAFDSPVIEEPSLPEQGSEGAFEIELPELPFGEWSREDTSNGYRYVGENVDEWEMCEVFIGDLYADGFSVFELYFEPGGSYSYICEKTVGAVLYQVHIDGDAGAGTAVIKVER